MIPGIAPRRNPDLAPRGTLAADRPHPAEWHIRDVGNRSGHGAPLAAKLIGMRQQEAQGVTEEEIHAMLEEGSESGVIEQQERDMVRNVFRLDEYGEVQGLVTLQDVLEAVTGEFKPRSQEDAWAVQRDDGSWLLDGLIPIPELKDKLALKAVPEEDKGRYHTLSGLVMWLLGRLPEPDTPPEA